MAGSIPQDRQSCQFLLRAAIPARPMISSTTVLGPGTALIRPSDQAACTSAVGWMLSQNRNLSNRMCWVARSKQLAFGVKLDFRQGSVVLVMPRTAAWAATAAEKA